MIHCSYILFVKYLQANQYITFVTVDSMFHRCESSDTIVYLHPAETSKNSDNCDFLKVSDIGKIIVLNGETYILNDTIQFSEDMREIYIWKNLLK